MCAIYTHIPAPHTHCTMEQNETPWWVKRKIQWWEKKSEEGIRRNATFETNLSVVYTIEQQHQRTTHYTPCPHTSYILDYLSLYLSVSCRVPALFDSSIFGYTTYCTIAWQWGKMKYLLTSSSAPLWLSLLSLLTLLSLVSSRSSTLRSEGTRWLVEEEEESLQPIHVSSSHENRNEMDDNDNNNNNNDGRYLHGQQYHTIRSYQPRSLVTDDVSINCQ
jgi:hypothetical protein